MSLNKICISIISDEKYEKYIPYFIYFITKSYPTYHIKILFLGNLSKKIKSLIDYIDNPLVTIEENFFKNAPTSNQELKSIRWLLPEKTFNNFEYVYIGDVDLLICKEDSSLLEQHTTHIEKSNIPYSNCIRPNTNRLTGLHFFKVKEYYKYMNDIIKEYTKKINDKKFKFKSGYRNEHFLYDIIEKGIGELPKDENRIDVGGSGPHHGLHLGIWRNTHKVKKLQKDRIIRDSYKDHFDFYTGVKKEKTFLYLKEKLPLKEFSNMEKFFNTIK